MPAFLPAGGHETANRRFTVDQNSDEGILDKAKNAISNLFGGEGTDASDDIPADIGTTQPTYKTSTDQDTATGSYPTSTGQGTGVAADDITSSDWAQSSTTEPAPEYKSGTDQDTDTGRSATVSDVARGDMSGYDSPATGSSTWDAPTETEVVTPATNYDAQIASPAGAAQREFRSGSTQGGYDAGAGAGSSLSGSDTRFEPTGEPDLESETVRRSIDEEPIDQP